MALFDYARQNRDLLGNQSVIIYDSSSDLNNKAVEKKFASEFETIPIGELSQVDAQIKREACDLMYVIKSGKRSDLMSRAVPTMVHAVFPQTVRHVHGASYAFVSEWLSDVCSRKLVPWVPHIVSIGSTKSNMRSTLGIPEDALVFGCYGGRKSFDIEFVRRIVIPKVLETMPNVFFLFMNIEQFVEHPRVIFLSASVDIEEKTAFINSCDAMLHARLRGETFGLAVGEFSLRRKPVLTFGKSRERAHLDPLGDTALVYHDADELYHLIRNFVRDAPSAMSTYQKQYSAVPVMKKFSDNLVRPALTGDMNGAEKRLGLQKWNPALLLRPKIIKKANSL